MLVYSIKLLTVALLLQLVMNEQGKIPVRLNKLFCNKISRSNYTHFDL